MGPPGGDDATVRGRCRTDVDQGLHGSSCTSVDDDGELLWTDDHEPPPYRRAVEARADDRLHRTMFVPLSMSGDLQIEIGLYSPATGKRVPSAAPRAARTASPRSRLRRSPTLFVFKDGWRPGGSGREGRPRVAQWSRQRHLAFRNPMRRRATGSSWISRVGRPRPPQQVEVRIGGVVDPSVRPRTSNEIRRMAIAEAMGDGETVDMRFGPRRNLCPGLDSGPQEHRPPGTGRPGLQRLPRPFPLRTGGG